jgi:hypothetical protein
VTVWRDAHGSVARTWAPPADARKTLFIDLLPDDGLPENVVELIAFLSDRLAEVPAEHRADVYLKIGYESDYDGGGYVSVTFGYERTETNEEMAARAEKERNDILGRKIAQENQERAMLAELKRKYEP